MMKDVLLLHVPYFGVSNIQIKKISIGLFSICNELNKNGINTEIVNLAVELEIDKNFSIIDYLQKNKVKLIVFSLHWFYQLKSTLEIAKNIKQQIPDIFIILGGYTASCFYQEIMKQFNFINFIIKGEGEIPLLFLCKYLLNKEINIKVIPNLVYRMEKNRIVLNKNVWFASSKDLNYFDFSKLFYMKNYKKYIEIIQCFDIAIGRGCPGSCYYCSGGINSTKIISGRNIISIRDINVVVNEIIKLCEFSNSPMKFCFSFDPKPEKQTHLVNLINILGKIFPKKIMINIECWGLPTKELVDSVKNNLNEESFLIISPEFANEKLRKIFKSFYYSNKDLYKILDYMEKEKVKSKVYFSRLKYENYLEYSLRNRMIKILLIKYMQIKYIFSLEIPIFDPYCPILLNSQKYKLKTHDMNFEFYYNL